MNYIMFSPNKLRLFACFFTLFFANLEAQKPVAVFAKSIDSIVEIAGAWEFDLGNQTGTKILNINQTGAIAIGTFHEAPVIVNVIGNVVKFKCDQRKKNGEKIRYMFKGEASEDKIIGKMSVYSYRKKTFETTDLVAVKRLEE